MIVSYNSSKITVFKTVSLPEGVIVEYQFSDNPDEPPIKYIPFIFGGNVVRFKGSIVGDSNNDDWNTQNPPKVGKYKWMRISTDGGLTWSYSNITGPEPSTFSIGFSKLSFIMNARGAVDREERLSFWIKRTNIPIYDRATWKVTPSYILADPDSVNYDSIEVVIPKGFEEKSFTVELGVGSFTKTEKLTITGDMTGSIVNEKLPTVYSTETPPNQSIFPTMIRDGVSPVKDGDYIIVQFNIPDEKPYAIPYRYSEKIDASTGNIEGWVPTTNGYNNHSEIMANCLQEVLASGNTVPSTSAYYGFFQSLVANDAFITFLESQYLHIKGAIYGGGYDKDGDINKNESGFYIDAKGTISSNKGRFQEAQVNGNFSCSDEYGNIMHTAKASVGKSFTFEAPSRWRFSDLRNAVNLDNDVSVTYKGNNNIIRKFTYNIDLKTDMASFNEKVFEQTFKIPFAGNYDFIYTIYGTRSEFEVKVNGSRLIYVAPSNESGEVSNRKTTILLNANDSVYIYARTRAVSPVGGDPQRIKCLFTSSVKYAYMRTQSNEPVAQFFDEKDYYLENRMTCEGFDSNNSKKLSNTDVLRNLSISDYMYPLIIGNKITYEGNEESVSYVLKSASYTEIVFGNGVSRRFPIVDRSEFADVGWCDISGTVTLMDTLRGLMVQSIFPNVNTEGSTDGSNIGSSKRPFSSLSAKTISGTTINATIINGNVNDKDNMSVTKYRVWGAVFN